MWRFFLGHPDWEVQRPPEFDIIGAVAAMKGGGGGGGGGGRGGCEWEVTGVQTQ